MISRQKQRPGGTNLLQAAIILEGPNLKTGRSESLQLGDPPRVLYCSESITAKAWELPERERKREDLLDEKETAVTAEKRWGGRAGLGEGGKERG